MTEKLYYFDSELFRFTANVTRCEGVKGGYAVVLDATAFYPEGGGQACDLGTLGGVKVLDVQEQGQDVIHLCDGPLTPGAAVEGIVDEARRFDLMQQHTGEHIVSGIICRRFGYHNVGFHMGSDVITIDFDGPVPLELLPQIEAEANRAVWQDLPVECHVPSPEALPHAIYRSKRALPWPVRIVRVGDVDSCACCGVHVKRSGQVGLIKLFSCVKFHQGVRMEMACGQRALAILNSAYDQNRQVGQAFSAKMNQTGEAARKMNQRLADMEYRCTLLERQIFDTIAAGYAGAGNVLRFADGLTPLAVRELADRIAGACGGIAAVCSGSAGQFNICLVNHNGDVKEFGNAMNKALNGRGGGKQGIFQGSIKAEKEAIVAFFQGFSM